MPKSSPRKTMGDNLKDLISSSYFQGLTALAGLIAALASDNLIIRIPALIILFGFLFALRFTISHLVKDISIWLTWKFFLGIIIGIFAGAIFYPVLQSTLKLGISFFIPQVEITDTFPNDGETLQSLSDEIEINFSQRIPLQYHSSWLVKTEITPYIPIKRIWVYDFDRTDCCRTLYIESARYFPNSGSAQFEPNTTYHLKISGFLIKNPLDIEFHTPPK
jgi:hypothetical protein